MPTFQFSLVILLERCPVSSPAIKSKGKNKDQPNSHKETKTSEKTHSLVEISWTVFKKLKNIIILLIS